MWFSNQFASGHNKFNHVISSIIQLIEYIGVTFKSILWKANKRIKKKYIYFRLSNELFIEVFEMMFIAAGAILMLSLTINMNEVETNRYDVWMKNCITVSIVCVFDWQIDKRIDYCEFWTHSWWIDYVFHTYWHTSHHLLKCSPFDLQLIMANAVVFDRVCTWIIIIIIEMIHFRWDWMDGLIQMDRNEMKQQQQQKKCWLYDPY